MHKRKDSFLFFLFISYQFNHVTATLIWLEEKEIKLPVIELCMMYCMFILFHYHSIQERLRERNSPQRASAVLNLFMFLLQHDRGSNA